MMNRFSYPLIVEKGFVSYDEASKILGLSKNRIEQLKHNYMNVTEKYFKKFIVKSRPVPYVYVEGLKNFIEKELPKYKKY